MISYIYVYKYKKYYFQLWLFLRIDSKLIRHGYEYKNMFFDIRNAIKLI